MIVNLSSLYSILFLLLFGWKVLLFVGVAVLQTNLSLYVFCIMLLIANKDVYNSWCICRC